jgi:hypothetical protein
MLPVTLFGELSAGTSVIPDHGSRSAPPAPAPRGCFLRDGHHSGLPSCLVGAAGRPLGRARESAESSAFTGISAETRASVIP